MNLNELMKTLDHTLLLTESTLEEMVQTCDDAINYGAKSVCIPPAYVKQAKAYVKDRVLICTVIGFPNGYSTTAVKVYETQDAILNGADEIDMVIWIGALKNKEYDQIEHEIRSVKEACSGRILKVIIETCLLSQEEKIKMCEIVTRAGADYIKTSTGFQTHGATYDDVSLLAEHIGGDVRIKAAGGIASIEDAKTFLSLGASRLGTSRVIKILKKKTMGVLDGRDTKEESY